MKRFLLQLFDLITLDYIPICLIGVLAGFAFSSNGLAITVPVALALISALLIILGFGAFNSVVDRDVHLINRPNRHMAIRTMSNGHAILLAIIFFILALAAAYWVNLTFFYVALTAVLLSIFYSFPLIHLRRRFIFGTFTPMVLYAFLFPLAGWAIAPHNPIPTILMAYLFVFGISIAVLKDFEDIDGNLRYRIKTPMIKMGYKRTVQFMAVALLISVVLLIALVFTGRLAVYYLPVAVLTIPALLNLNYLYETRTAREGREAFIRGLSILMLIEILFIILVLIK